ncbi:MAG: autorepressor SdpR family transcription factor [Candidatus Brocadiia bacterium]
MNAMDKVYKACADATRRKILKLLRERDMTAGEIASRFNVTKPTVSSHFAVLREAGLIQGARSGRNITYHLNTAMLEKALLALMEDYDFVWIPSGNIDAVAIELVESLVRADFAAVARDFDSQLASPLTPEKLARAWRLTLRQFGPFLKQLETRTERYWKFTSVIVTCEFAKSNLDIKVTFSRTGKISGFWILKTD